MVAEMIRHDEDVEVVDLDAMTVEELVKEQADCWAEIQQIEAQLADPRRIFELGATEYTAWRGRAVWALRHRKIELHDIAAALKARRLADLEVERVRQQAQKEAEKHRIAAEKWANKIANGWDPNAPKKPKKKTSPGPFVSPEEIERRTIDAKRRRALVVDALRGNGGADGLLIRMAVVVHHIQGGRGLPEDFPDECRQTLSDLSAYLKDLVGDSPLSAARTGRLTADSVIEEVAP